LEGIPEPGKGLILVGDSVHVTTVVPVYNGGPFIEATLRSLLGQTRRPDRLIVQDNCSTDDTAEIAKRFAGEGVEYRRTAEHLHSGLSFNLGMEFASETDVLHMMTADDLVKPTFVERVLEPLVGVEGNALSYSAFEVIDEEGRLLEEGDLANSFRIEPGVPVREIPMEDFLAAQAVLRTICTPAVLMKTDRRPLPAGLRLEFIQCADAVFFSECTRDYKRFFEVPEALCQYRRHGDTTTTRNRERPAELIQDYWRATSRVDEIRGKSGWMANFRRRCFVAAAARILLSGIEDLDSVRRAEALRTTRAITGLPAWCLGNLAVALRRVLGQGHARSS